MKEKADLFEGYCSSRTEGEVGASENREEAKGAEGQLHHDQREKLLLHEYGPI